jgi:ABC-type multidrug transport system fused ATPase/permease subunit
MVGSGRTKADIVALSGFFTGLMKGVGASQRVLGVLAMPSPIPLAVGQPLPKDRNGTIELQNIRFFYPSRPDVQVLKGLDLKVERGERVALV